jgi:hypothetical protein
MFRARFGCFASIGVGEHARALRQCLLQFRGLSVLAGGGNGSGRVAEVGVEGAGWSALEKPGHKDT